MNIKNNLGFTLMELLAVIAIIGVLIVIAVPTYKHYIRRAHYTEIVQAATPFKMAVEYCYQLTGTLSDCSSGKNGVPFDVLGEKGKGLVSDITITAPGVITITPKTLYGFEKKDTYVLLPSEENGHLNWNTTGGGVAAGYAD